MFKKFNFIVSDSGCFICTTHNPEREGYYRITINGKQVKLHRFIYEQMFGEIPKGKVIRHICNNPSCINPEHLALGTQKENMKDKKIAGTQFCPKGELHGSSKLTELDVINIRKSDLSERTLAKIYGVSNITIHQAKSKKTWKHV